MSTRRELIDGQTLTYNASKDIWENSFGSGINGADVYQKVVSNCVQISTHSSNNNNNSTGSGVFIRGSEFGGSHSELFILTSTHTVNRFAIDAVCYITYLIDISQSSGKITRDHRAGRAKVWAYNIRNDIALLRFLNEDLPDSEIRGVELFRVDLLKQNFKTGESVGLIGNPLGVDDFSLSTGVVRESYLGMSNVGNSIIVPNSFTVDASIIRGNSGGGVFLPHHNHKLAGIVSWGFTRGGSSYGACVHPLTIQTVLTRMYSEAKGSNIDVNQSDYTPYRYKLSWMNLTFSYNFSRSIKGLMDSGLNLTPTTSTRGATYQGTFSLDISPPVELPNKSLIRKIGPYDIGGDYPFLPLDFSFSLIPPGTKTPLLYRELPNWSNDLAVTVTYITMPEEADRFLQSISGATNNDFYFA